MEGGNWATTANDIRDTPEDLGLLTTIHRGGNFFTVTRDTSAATAAASRLAARIMCRYPKMTPQTVRGLMVHSARWTEAMLKRFPGATKADVQKRLRCYGFGRPDYERAAFSAESSATMIYEGQLTPFRHDGSKVKANEMHVHELPWPTDVLEGLGNRSVHLRVTLSYYVEPSPGRRGWTRRFRYASHGLRFDIRRPNENYEQFLARLSQNEDDTDEPGVEENEDPANVLPWEVGVKGRARGSLHSDCLVTTGQRLGQSGYIAIFPVTGWWRERTNLNRWNSPAPYSLLVTLETAAQDVDLYSSIQNKLEVAVPA